MPTSKPMLKVPDASAPPSSMPISTCAWAGAVINALSTATIAAVRPIARALW
jgi:hypothetical protein